MSTGLLVSRDYTRSHGYASTYLPPAATFPRVAAGTLAAKPRSALRRRFGVGWPARFRAGATRGGGGAHLEGEPFENLPEVDKGDTEDDTEDPDVGKQPFGWIGIPEVRLWVVVRTQSKGES